VKDIGWVELASMIESDKMWTLREIMLRLNIANNCELQYSEVSRGNFVKIHLNSDCTFNKQIITACYMN